MHKTAPPAAAVPTSSVVDDSSVCCTDDSLVHKEAPTPPADDVQTSMGDSCQSESASMGDGSTPRLEEAREEPSPRWSDLVEDPAFMSDAAGDEDNKFAATKDKSVPRRRRHRGNRSRRTGHGNTRVHEQEHRRPAGNADAFHPSGLRDRDVVTLADLGLLISTPDLAVTQQCASPSATPSDESGSVCSPTRAAFGQRSMLGTTFQFQAYPISPGISTDAASRAYPMAGGYGYACRSTQREFVQQPMVNKCESVSAHYGTDVPSPCNRSVPHEGASTQSLRTWLQSGLLLASGVDVMTEKELRAAAPEVYED